MLYLVGSSILVILLIWSLVEYIKWRKKNKIEEDLERSRNKEKALQKRAKTLKTNIKNVAVAKALDDLEDDLEDDDIDFGDLVEQVERVVQPESFEQEFESKFSSNSDLSDSGSDE